MFIYLYHYNSVYVILSQPNNDNGNTYSLLIRLYTIFEPICANIMYVISILITFKKTQHNTFPENLTELHGIVKNKCHHIKQLRSISDPVLYYKIIVLESIRKILLARLKSFQNISEK